MNAEKRNRYFPSFQSQQNRNERIDNNNTTAATAAV